MEKMGIFHKFLKRYLTSQEKKVFPSMALKYCPDFHKDH